MSSGMQASPPIVLRDHFYPRRYYSFAPFALFAIPLVAPSKGRSFLMPNIAGKKKTLVAHLLAHPDRKLQAASFFKKAGNLPVAEFTSIPNGRSAIE
jgi:hypothetical protein